ncbi:hypothetical protein [Cetobacterium sp.]|uniref:hypothetical protein n=1 Tax=Cetobacterium sp. TaxID=2071632 RepID=UPI003EE45DA6
MNQITTTTLFYIGDFLLWFFNATNFFDEKIIILTKIFFFFFKLGVKWYFIAPPAFIGLTVSSITLIQIASLVSFVWGIINVIKLIKRFYEII